MRLQGVGLTGAELRGAHLRRANLDGADVRKASLVWADLREANLTGAKLKGAEFALFLLEQAFFDGAAMPDGKENNKGTLQQNKEGRTDLLVRGSSRAFSWFSPSSGAGGGERRDTFIGGKCNHNAGRVQGEC